MDRSSAAQGRLAVSIQGDYGEPDVVVTADVGELWERYGVELREDGMGGKSPEDVIRHVYEQNCDAPELEVENEWI